MLPESSEKPTEFSIVITPSKNPPPLGFLLSLMAVGLALAPSRLVGLLDTFGGNGPSAIPAAIDTLGLVGTSVWAIVNLVLLVKRRRQFPWSMISLIGFAFLVNVAGFAFDPSAASELGAAGVTTVLILSVVVGGLWVAYLLLSKHVASVFVR
jgi:hypothetical protein